MSDTATTSDAPFPDDIEDIYELSPMQVGMMFQTMMAPSSGVFVEQTVMHLPGALSTALFEQAWQSVVDRTPILRTAFHWDDLEKPVQVVHRGIRMPVEHVDWSGLSAPERAGKLAEQLRKARERGFVLDRPPLMRLVVIRASQEESWFVWHFHHLLLDGWSSQLLMQEVVEQYKALASSRPYHAPERPPFRDYIAWLQVQSEPEAEAFWRADLKDFTTPTPLGFGRTAPEEGVRLTEGELLVTLSPGESEALRRFAKTHRLTLNTVVQGAWARLLGALGGEREVVHGVVVSGRPPELPGVDAMIGLFINTLPMRIALHPEDELVPWLRRIQGHSLDAARHGHVSSLQLQRWSEVPSGTRLYETVVVFENFPFAQQPQPRVLAEEPFSGGRTDVALTVLVIPGAEISFRFLYDDRRFEAVEMARVGECLATLLRAMPAQPRARLRDLPLLSAAERERVLVEWNATAVSGYDRTPFVQLLAERARKAPGAVAFIEDDRPVLLADVDDRSSRLAQFLAELGVAEGTVLGVCHNRSVEAVVACLAAWKRRAVFLPLDPSYPRDRLAYMAADAEAAVVLGLDPELAPEARAVTWDEVWRGSAGHEPTVPSRHSSPDDLAYILYTSGSTGRPKGVAVEHRTVLNRLAWMWNEYSFAPGDVGVMKTALNFVDAFWEMLGGLTQGVPVVVAPPDVVMDPGAFVDFLARHGVTSLWFVPSFLELLLDSGVEFGTRLPKLRFWSSGGERLSAELYRRFERAAPHATLYNVFGATELWDVTVFDPRRDGQVAHEVPLGRPIANTEVYVLDPLLQPVPAGVSGTLYVGGAPLARGYVGREASSRQRFIPHPFRDNPGARLYDTGDLARYRADGVLEYVGRRDQQLKVRGYRIEPAEIESMTEACPLVRESLVAAHGIAGDQRLTAYVVARNGSADTEALLCHLRRWLPAFMLPAVTWVDEIPKTPSGKKDRSQTPLPASRAVPAEFPRRATAPLEDAVADEFRSVLGVAVVAPDDHFFANLGGHSLLATRLVSRLRERFGVEVPLRAVFDAPTPAALAAVLDPLLQGVAVVDETAAILAALAELPEDQAEALLRSVEGSSIESSEPSPTGGEP